MDLKPIEILNVILKRDNITYTEIAKKLNLSPQSVAQIFKSGNVSINKLCDVAKAAGYDVKIEFEKIEK